jgi:hypothetical protein
MKRRESARRAAPIRQSRGDVSNLRAIACDHFMRARQKLSFRKFLTAPYEALSTLPPRAPPDPTEALREELERLKALVDEHRAEVERARARAAELV